MTVIPNPPTLGDKFTNDTTGVSYEYDGEKWIITSTPGSENADQLDADLTALTTRVSTGEDIQEQIQETISDALDTQSNIKNSVIELEEEIESLAPSLDRGKWNLATLGAGVTLAPGEYGMGIGVDSQYCQEKYLECLEAANNDPFEMSECTRLAGECGNAKDNGQEYYINDWSHADFLHFHKTDSEGKNHTFSDYEVGMFIDLFDQGDTGFAVFEITAAPTLDGDVYTIGVTPIQHEGEASGLARIKVFELSGADPTDFIRKEGDTMRGKLNINPSTNIPPFYIYSHQDVTPTTYSIRQFGIPYTAEDGSTKRDTVFYTTAGGDVGVKSGWVPTRSNYLTTKGYVDNLVDSQKGPATFRWKAQVNSKAGARTGVVQLSGENLADSSEIRISVRSLNGLSLEPLSSGRVLYEHQNISAVTGYYNSMTITVWYIGSDTDNLWRWKGTAEIKKITAYNLNPDYQYLQLDLGGSQEYLSKLKNDLEYYVTIPGFF